MEHRHRNVFLKTGLVIVLVIIVAIGAALVWLNQTHQVTKVHVHKTGHTHQGGAYAAAITKTTAEEPNYTTLLKKYIPEFVNKYTHGLYQLYFDDIRIDAIAGNIKIRGIRFQTDSRIAHKLAASGHAPQYLATINIPSAEITGVSFAAILADKTLKCKSLIISHPQEIIIANGSHNADNDNSLLDSNTGIHHVLVERLVMEEPEINFQHKGSSQYNCTVKGGNIILNNWELGNTDNKTANNFFFAKSGNITLRELEYKKPGIFYKISSSGLAFDTRQNEVVLKNIRIAPLVKKEDYYQHMGEVKEIYKVAFPEVYIKNIDWNKITRNDFLYASSMTLINPAVDVYLDRFPPPDSQSRVEQFPHQLLRKCKLNIYVPNIQIRNGLVKYTEHNRQTKMESHVVFANMNGTISNVTNVPQYIRRNPHCVAKLQTMYKYKSPITSTFDMLLSDAKNGSFSFKGRLTGLDASEISGDFRAMSLLEIESVRVNEIEMSMSGNQWGSHGEVKVLYNDLKVKLKEYNKKGELNDRHVSSLMANHVYIFPDNPMPNDIVRTASTSIPHNRERSFFALIWNNLREGVDKTVIKDSSFAENVSRSNNPEKHKKGAVKGFFKSIFRKKAR